MTACSLESLCCAVQLLRWLADSGMVDLWIAGQQVSSHTFCKLWAGQPEGEWNWHEAFYVSLTLFFCQAVRKPSFLRWNWWWRLWKPRQESVPKDPGGRLWVWLTVLGWDFRFRYVEVCVSYWWLLQPIVLTLFEPESKMFSSLSDFSAKSLVARLMEVDQDQRLTAQEAINHEW